MSKEIVLCFCFSSLRYWSRNFALLSRPINSKTKTNCNLVTLISPSLAVTCIRFEFWLACWVVFFCWHGPEYFVSLRDPEKRAGEAIGVFNQFNDVSKFQWIFYFCHSHLNTHTPKLCWSLLCFIFNLGDIT